MAHGCLREFMSEAQIRRQRKWTVRRRERVWCVYPPGQCCSASSHWFFWTAINRAQELARGRC